MRKRFLFSLAMCGLVVFNSFSVEAKSVHNLKFNKDTVINTGESEIYIREEPNVVSRKVGVLEENQSFILTGKSDGDFVEVTSGDITGWVILNDSLVSGHTLKEYVLANPADFDIEVQAVSPTGIYTDRDSLDADKLDYDTKATIRKSQSKIRFYKTPVLKKYIDGFSVYKDYAKISKKETILRSIDGKKSSIVKKGDEFQVVEKSGSFYKVCDGDKNYIVHESDCEIVDREEKLSNIVGVDFKYGVMYDIEVLDNNVARITVDYEDYYISTDDLYIFYMINSSSLAFSVANSDKTYALSKITKDNECYKISVENSISKTSLPAFVSADDCNLLVNFEDCSEYIEPEDDTEPDIGTPDFESLLSDSVCKDRYHYDYDNGSTDERNEIVNYALQFLGRPYVYGGTSLTNGIDCSAFCMRVLQHFGKNITRTTSTQVADGYGRKIGVNDLQPGDLIYYTRDGSTPYHVVMYLGGDKCVNASCRKYGVCISTVKFDSILCIKNYID